MKIKTTLQTVFALLLVTLISNTSLAQNKKELYRLKVIKTKNGVNKVIDTSFNNRADFDAYQKANIPKNMPIDMLQLDEHKDKLRDSRIQVQIGDSLANMKLKVVRIKRDDESKERILNASNTLELLKELNINIDSLTGVPNTKVKLVNIYSRIEFVDAPLSIIKNNKHPQIRQAAKGEKLMLKSVNVYPNPSNGKVFLDIETSAPGKVELLVTDIQGKEVFRDSFYNDTPSKVQRNLNIDGQKSGVYLLKITSQGKSIVKKLIFEN